MRMRRLCSKKTALLAVLAFVMVLGLSVKDSLAYFTTYVTAQGGSEVTLGWKTEIDEELDGTEKTIRIENTGELDCYVRIKVLAAEEANVSYSGSKKWTKNETDGYWYYSDVLKAGASTEALTASIGPVDKDVIQADFDVVVVHESAPVLYDEEGNPLPCSHESVWSQKIERKGA